MPPRSATSPQAQIDLRAQMEECPPVYLKILGAFNIKGWKNGKRKLKIRDIWAYSGVSPETLKDALAGMCERGWLSREREPGGAYTYEKTIEEMTWDEAHEIGRHRLSGEAQQQTLFDKKLEPRTKDVPRGTKAGVGPSGPEGQAKLASPPSNSVGPNPPEGEANSTSGSGQLDPSLNILRSSSKVISKVDSAEPDGSSAEGKSKRKAKPPKPPYAAADGSGWNNLVAAYSVAWMAARRATGVPGESTDQERADLAGHIQKGARALSGLGKKGGFTLVEFQARLGNMSKHQFHAKQDFSLTFFCSHYSEFADGQAALRETGRANSYHGARADDWGNSDDL